MRKFLAQPFAAIPFRADKIVAFLFDFGAGIGQQKSNRLSILKQQNEKFNSL